MDPLQNLFLLGHRAIPNSTHPHRRHRHRQVAIWLPPLFLPYCLNVAQSVPIGQYSFLEDACSCCTRLPNGSLASMFYHYAQIRQYRPANRVLRHVVRQYHLCFLARIEIWFLTNQPLLHHTKFRNFPTLRHIENNGLLHPMLHCSCIFHPIL